MSEGIERERLDVDILFVGAGAATLASAIRLAQLCQERGLELPSVLVIEKASEIGGHQLSGAVVDPRALRELMPDFLEKGFPLEYECSKEYVYFMTRRRALRLWPVPPPMRNHGNLVVSLASMVKWLAERAEERGIEIYPGFAAARPLYDGERVEGVVIRDQGIGRDGKPKGVFQAGPEIHARCVVFGEGPRGSCAKEIFQRFGLQGRNPQAYEAGIKELWRVRPENHVPGRVIHTLGFPFDPATFGGTWLYDMKDELVSLGVVTGLNYESPYEDPHDNMQRFKLHPKIRKILEGGECIRYGAKTLPAGGYHSFPQLWVEGALFVGDSAGFCNAARLKGVHQAMKSGMLAAEVLAEGIARDDFSADVLRAYPEKVEQSWAWAEHRQYRSFHPSFHWTQRMPRWLGWLRQLPWLVNSQVIAPVTGGRGLVDPVPTHPDHTHMKKLRDLGPAELAKREKVAYDNKYTFDKVTAVALAGSRHEVDQPHHLVVHDTEVCATRCAEEYGNPCEHFCPAAVYEMIDDPRSPHGRSLVIHHENCVHCKTCDVMDPYQIITWTTPEGGDGPDYTRM